MSSTITLACVVPAQLAVVRPIDTPHQSLLWGPWHHGTQGEPMGNPGLSQQSSAPGYKHFCYSHFDKNPMIRPTDQADVPAPTPIILHLPRISPSRTFRDNLSVIIKKSIFCNVILGRSPLPHVHPYPGPALYCLNQILIYGLRESTNIHSSLLGSGAGWAG